MRNPDPTVLLFQNQQNIIDACRSFDEITKERAEIVQCQLRKIEQSDKRNDYYEEERKMLNYHRECHKHQTRLNHVMQHMEQVRRQLTSRENISLPALTEDPNETAFGSIADADITQRRHSTTIDSAPIDDAPNETVAGASVAADITQSGHSTTIDDAPNETVSSAFVAADSVATFGHALEPHESATSTPGARPEEDQGNPIATLPCRNDTRRAFEFHASLPVIFPQVIASTPFVNSAHADYSLEIGGHRVNDIDRTYSAAEFNELVLSDEKMLFLDADNQPARVSPCRDNKQFVLARPAVRLRSTVNASPLDAEYHFPGMSFSNPFNPHPGHIFLYTAVCQSQSTFHRCCNIC